MTDLIHYGKKGMKWGFRRGSFKEKVGDSLGSKIQYQSDRYSNMARATKRRVDKKEARLTKRQLSPEKVQRKLATGKSKVEELNRSARFLKNEAKKLKQGEVYTRHVLYALASDPIDIFFGQSYDR